MSELVVEVVEPAGALQVVEVISESNTELVEIEVPGQRGPRGPSGPTGPQGPAGETDPDLPDLTLLFENGLI